MKTLLVISNLESEIKDIRALEAKINELTEMKQEKEAIIKSARGVEGGEEMKRGALTVRFTNVVRKNFSTTACKKK